MNRFDADQGGNASNICEAQDQEDGYLCTKVHVQAADYECRKDAEGPISKRRYCRVGIREAKDNVGIYTMTLAWITRCRPEEPDRLTLSDDLGHKCNSEEARKDHDTPDNLDMATFCRQAKQECASSEFGEGG